MATGGIENMSDEIIHIKCCICNKKNIKTEAEKYCVQCQDYYCTSCADMHKMFLPSSIEHKLLDKGDFVTTGLATGLPSIPTQRCDEHPTKLADMFCKDHDEIICSSCVALKHRTCQDIHSIPDEIDNLYNPAVYAHIKCQMNAVEKTLEDLKNVKENLITELDHCRKTATGDIKAYRKEMEAFLDKLEAESLKDVEEIYRKIEAGLKQELDEIKKNSYRLKQSAIQLRESIGNKAQEFIYMKFAEQKIKQAEAMNKSQSETAGCTDVCVTNEEETEVVVTSRNRLIQFVDIGVKMVATKQLKFDHNVFGVACKNNHIFVSDGEKKFYIYDMTGKIVHSIKNDNLGNPLFRRTRHLTISDDMVYIADNDKGLIALDINGSYKFTFTDPALRRTQWVCSDRRGNLLVGGFDSTEIFQINEASRKVIGVFGKMVNSISACYDPEHNKFIVTVYNNDKVKLYEVV